MGCNDRLIPARFLCLVSHLSMLAIILWSREENLKACLPYDYEESDLKTKDQEMLIGLSAALCLIGFELLGFLSGISMFFPCVSLTCILFFHLCI
ncbi:unnamed protein product [Bemisia tabaci]|uniref:Transmembrane protein 107 n=1 Tax=Bemisia tabaci TaxID=7038 RepID=A0A9P0F094_BEMTA|nr:unnamed protein product [Bemisia tabaci]